MVCSMLALEPLSCPSCTSLVCGNCEETTKKCVKCAEAAPLVPNAFAKKWIARTPFQCRVGCE